MKLFAASFKGLALPVSVSFYWSSWLLQYTSWSDGIGAGFGQGYLGSVSSVFALVILLCFSRYFLSSRAQKNLAISGAALLSMGIVVYFIGSSNPIFLTAAIYTITSSVGSACILVFWGFSFISMSKNEAEKAALLGILLTFVLYLILGLFPVSIWGPVGAALLRIISVAPYIVSGHCVTLKRHSVNPGTFGVMLPLYASRVMLGMLTGIAIRLRFASGRPDFEPSVGLSGILVFVAIAFIVYLLVSNRVNRSILVISPFLIVGVLVGPYIASEEIKALLYFVEVAALHLLWLFLAAIQLSDIKERAGLDEPFLFLSEKVVLYTSAAVGTVLGSYFANLLEATDKDAGLLITVLVYVLLVAYCYLIAQVVGRKERESFFEKGKLASAEQAEKAYKSVAERFSLTPREQQVYRLLAEGHTRSEMCERLHVSQNTINTHIEHIYKKLGVNSRQSLRNQLEDERKSISYDYPV